jgi:conjugative relaxase-like TrwC/TraI family protein
MLGIHGVRRDGAGYYLSDPALELPEAVPPRWAGDAAAGLGLHGLLVPDDFEHLLNGSYPELGTGRARVAAFDLTFSAPKSVSVVFALGGRDAAGRVVAAHEEAVDGARRYLEHHAVTVARQVGGERVVLPTSGMVAGSFTHGRNRNGDPHLHSHVVMANLVHGADGRWGACDRRGLDAHRRAASAVYEAHLRASLSSSLGVRWTAAREVAGVAPELLGEFSSRAADIRAAGGSRLVAWAATRPAKDAPVRYDDLVVEWRGRARAAAGVPAPELDRGPARTFLDEHRVAAVVSLTAHGGAHRRDVTAAMASGAQDGVRDGALGHLVDLWVPPAARGVGEPLRSRRDVLPANHHLRALGPRPLDPSAHAVWMSAARTLDAYRARWGLERAREPLGEAPPATLPAAHLADRVRTVRQLDEARVRLAIPAPVRELEIGPGLGHGR